MVKLKGLFVTFDGPNGVGKSSILRGVANQLMQIGFNIFETKEPTLSPLGQFVRNAEEVYKGRTLACLVAADRYFHIDHEILPALSEGKVVLSDRYIESSLVLQRLDDVEITFIWSLNSQIYVPDMSIILTARPEILDQRLVQRTQYSRFEKSKSRAEELKFYQEAAKFLSQRGFNVLFLENDVTPLARNVEQIVQKILTLKEGRKRYGR